MTAYLAALGFVVLAEMGDKTQLATVAPATEYQSILGIWLGTTSCMLVADAVGIITGIVQKYLTCLALSCDISSDLLLDMK